MKLICWNLQIYVGKDYSFQSLLKPHISHEICKRQPHIQWRDKYNFTIDQLRYEWYIGQTKRIFLDIMYNINTNFTMEQFNWSHNKSKCIQFGTQNYTSLISLPPEPTSASRKHYLRHSNKLSFQTL